ncbi:ribonucleoprotein PTB-binding 2 [Tenrec ecaudatus]|uniref:ribonucleoprotein PTB-binding 2 n=1 Tax=Tenrec ecaudatus TaxID=94439 RepID=UPI003F59065A
MHISSTVGAVSLPGAWGARCGSAAPRVVTAGRSGGARRPEVGAGGRACGPRGPRRAGAASLGARPPAQVSGGAPGPPRGRLSPVRGPGGPGARGELPRWLSGSSSAPQVSSPSLPPARRPAAGCGPPSPPARPPSPSPRPSLPGWAPLRSGLRPRALRFPSPEPPEKMAAAAAGGQGGAGSGPRRPGCSAEAHGRARGPAPLEPPEVAARLQRMRRELSNRRKILVRNLPQDSSCQEVHDLLQDYELKYCYVDKNKRTAFVTLLNGEQAQNAIRTFHQYCFRGKELVVQLQPTDALLCITNLPISFTLEEFEELVRAYGNIERCFLVYSEVTGQSKGYGFVEYMKKDFAAKARLELLGKQLGASSLFAQWMDVNLLASELIHSKCLCVDKLPSDYRDSEELLHFFSSVHKPVFCQLAQDEGSYVGGFAVVEYHTAEHAEEVQQAAAGMSIQGSKVQVSFCAPGAPGRSTLAALIAAQGVMHSSQKGLLPEPNPAQIMKSLNNPAMLQVLLQPQLCGRTVKPVLGIPHSLPHAMNPSVSPAFLHLNKAHQSSVLGSASSLFLQNLSPVPLAQQQLLKFENIQTNNKPGLLGEPPAIALQTALGLGSPRPWKAELGNHGEAQKTANVLPAQASVAAGMGVLPFIPSQLGAGHAGPGHSSAPEKKPAPVGMTEGTFSGSQAYLQSFPNLTAGGLLTGHPKQQQSQPKGTEISLGAAAKSQTSLLGEPPREIRLSKNPYLNLASVLPSVCLSPPASKTTLQKTGLTSNILEAISQGHEPQHVLEKCIAYSQPSGDYAQGSSLRKEKRSSSYLLSAPEGGPGELADQPSPGSGYVETYLKKKRVY